MSWHQKRFTPDAKKVQTACAECQRPMWLPASKVEDYRRCSPECRQKARERRLSERRRDCSTCGETFIPRKYQIEHGGGRFCSQACNAAAAEALQTPEAKARAKAAMAEMRKNGLINMASGERNPNWAGGISRANGYINLRAGSRYIPEHRLVMERHLGRPLNPDEVVHHINHDKTDNRIENLQVMSRAEHINEHRDDLEEGLRGRGK